MSELRANLTGEENFTPIGYTTSAESFITASNLTLQMPSQPKPIFQDRTIQLGCSERVTLVGHSGSGKTLFLRSLSLLEKHASGHILWKGKPITPTQIPCYRSQVIYVGQRTALSLGTVESAFNEVFAYQINSKKVWNKIQTQADLVWLGKSERFLNTRTDYLSGGERQIVNILRAVALQPEFLFLDEPTSALDPNTCRKVESLLINCFSGGWLWVTHQPDQVPRVSSRTIHF